MHILILKKKFCKKQNIKKVTHSLCRMSPGCMYKYNCGHLLGWQSVYYYRWSHLLVVVSRVMFARVVSSVEMASSPQKLEESLSFPTLEPLESHVVGLGGFRGHGAHGEPMSCVVVGCYWCGFSLRVSHFFQCCSIREGSFATVVKSPCFRF